MCGHRGRPPWPPPPPPRRRRTRAGRPARRPLRPRGTTPARWRSSSRGAMPVRFTLASQSASAFRRVASGVTFCGMQFSNSTTALPELGRRPVRAVADHRARGPKTAARPLDEFMDHRVLASHEPAPLAFGSAGEYVGHRLLLLLGSLGKVACTGGTEPFSRTSPGPGMKSASDETLLTVKQAAQILGVAPNTVRAWGATGKLPEYRHPMNNYRLYRTADLQAVLLQVSRPTSRSNARSTGRSPRPQGAAVRGGKGFRGEG